MLNNFFFFFFFFRESSENRAVNEIERSQMTIYDACRVTKAADTHSEYVTLIAFPQKQWLHEHASVLRYIHIACLVFLPPSYCILKRRAVWNFTCNNSEVLSNVFRKAFCSLNQETKMKTMFCFVVICPSVQVSGQT
jgi:hypothetical protein